MIMTKNTNPTVIGQYERPQTKVFDIMPEGILCGSFKQPGEDDDPYFGN